MCFIESSNVCDAGCCGCVLIIEDDDKVDVDGGPWCSEEEGGGGWGGGCDNRGACERFIFSSNVMIVSKRYAYILLIQVKRTNMYIYTHLLEEKKEKND